MTTPVQHPSLKPEKTGVLLLNLGTPESTDYWAVRRYLSEFLSDQRVVDKPRWLWQPILQGIILSRRPFVSGKAYTKIWNNDRNESPLKTHTRAQCDKLSALLQQQGIVCTWGMRYGKPSTQAGIDYLLEQGCRKILLFALYPQYSSATTATAYDKAFAALSKPKWQPAIRTATPWFDDPNYIAVLGDSIKLHLASLDEQPEHLLASFHGLPQRFLKEGDPYSCMCSKTARLTREYLARPEDKWHTTFQSRFGPEKWLQPYTDKTVIKLAEQGVKHLAVVSPAFVSDCLETLEEINIGIRELFLKHGGERFTYIPCLNASDTYINFLSQRITSELMGWL